MERGGGREGGDWQGGGGMMVRVVREMRWKEEGRSGDGVDGGCWWEGKGTRSAVIRKRLS